MARHAALHKFASLSLITVTLAASQGEEGGRLVHGYLPHTTWGEGTSSSGLKLKVALVEPEQAVTMPLAAASDDDVSTPQSIRPQLSATVVHHREAGAVESVPLTAQVVEGSETRPILWPQIGAKVSQRGQRTRPAAEGALGPQTGAVVGAASAQSARSPGEVAPESNLVQDVQLRSADATKEGGVVADLGLQMDVATAPAHAQPGNASDKNSQTIFPKLAQAVVDFGDKGSAHVFVLCILNVLALVLLFLVFSPSQARRSPGERKARFFEKVLRCRGPMPSLNGRRPVPGAVPRGGRSPATGGLGSF